MDLENAGVTADAAHAQRETAQYIAGKKQDGGRESDYFLFVKGNQPSLQRAVFDAVQEQGPRDPDHTELDRGHGRTVRHSIWVAAADLARIARGQWSIESMHWLRDTAYAEDANTGYAGNGPQVMATFRNLAISLLHLAGATEITRTLQAIARSRNRVLDYLSL